MAAYQCPDCGSTDLWVYGRQDIKLEFYGESGDTGACIDTFEVDAELEGSASCGCRRCDWDGDMRDAEEAAENAAEEEEEHEANKEPVDQKDRDEGGVV